MRNVVIAVLLVAAVATAGCADATPTSASAPTPAGDHAAKQARRPARAKRHPHVAARVARARASGSAAVALTALPVKGRAPKTGYSREEFGDGWLSVRGCDTRDRILNRDLRHKAFLDDCRVESGTLADPYTATRITYERGGASEVDIDHVVALSDAWQKGAQRWGRTRRVAFANDPLNLLAVDAGANRAKGDGDAAIWLPANKRFRCAYVARQVAVKRKYRVWITRGERGAIARVLGGCPGQPLPRAGARVKVPTTTISAPRHHYSGATGAGHVYANCDAARAAGAAPIMRGTPDYAANPKLDRDRDGVACES